MPALARTRSYQYLDLFTGTPGALADAVVVQFAIFDVSTATKMATPMKVYPADPATRADLNVTTDKIGTAHYRTTWAPVDVGTVLHSRGRHRISWYFKLTLTGVETEVSEDFDVVDTARSWGYCLPSELRDEGYTTDDVTAQRLATSIALATKMIERYTGQFFEPRAQVLSVDGNDEEALLLHQPIIWIEKADWETLFSDELLEVTEADLRAYNRHLTDGLMSPDDRQDPKVELVGLVPWLITWPASTTLQVLRWPAGVKNVRLTGVFGYTDPDGSPTGVPPDLLRHACKLLVAREMPTLSNPDDREDRQDRWRLTSERTRDQSRSMGPARTGGFTFDPVIDGILDGYRRPMMLGAA